MKKVFLEISQNSQEDTCARVSFFLLTEEGRSFDNNRCTYYKIHYLTDLLGYKACKISVKHY